MDQKVVSLQVFEKREQEIWVQYEKLLNEAGKDISSAKKLRDLYSTIASHYSFLVNNYASSSQSKRLAGYLYKSRQLLDIPIQELKHGFLYSFFAIYLEKIPRQIYQHRRLFFLSLLLFWSSVLVSFGLTVNFPEFGSSFLGSDQYHYYKSQVETGVKFQNFFLPESSGPIVFITVFLNNLKVSLLTLLGGMLFGVGTLYILIKNAFLVGGLLGIYYSGGHFADFASSIFQHGFWELMAISLSGMAGFLIASPYFFSGNIQKKDLFRKRARQAMLIFTGVITLLFLAGLIEGLVTTLHLPIPERFGVIILTMLLFGGYIFYSFSYSHKR